MATMSEYVELQAELEQVTAELARYENGRLVMVNEIARLREEIKRLTAVETKESRE